MLSGSAESQSPRDNDAEDYRADVQIGLSGSEIPHSCLEELAVGVNGRDPKAFSDLYELMADQLFRLALRLVDNRQEAEDAVQSAFLELARVEVPPASGVELEAWLLSSIRYSCLQASQTQARQEDITDEHHPVVDEEDDYDLGFDPHLEAALSLLTPEQRLVIHLKHVDGLNGHQIAQVTGTSRMAVYAMATRAERRLRHQLGAVRQRRPRPPSEGSGR
ncbi:MAG: sigma-70 family RNA polymerase sigma factor [Actinomycetia bacterium]|nr:sigma-70 family RNA polymerase sigma factor [Actinomycetes bacterium]